MLANRVLRQGMFLFLAATGIGFLNFVYQFVMGRWLGPDRYASLGALVGVLNTVAAALALSQLVLADQTARLVTLNKLGQARGLLRRVTGLLLGSALALVVLLIVARQAFARWLHVDSESSVIILALALGPTFVLPAFLGCLQGLQEFRKLSFVQLTAGMVRLIAAIILVLIGFGSAGALAGFVAAGLVSLAVAIWFFIDWFTKPVEPFNLRLGDLTGPALQTVLGTTAFTVLTSVDVIFARRIFASELAGQYGAAATLGKIVLFLPGPIATLMFPKSSSYHALGVSRGSIMLRSVAITLALCLAVTLGLAAWPSGLVNLLYGPAFIPAAGWLAIYGIVASGWALVYLFMMHYLAAHNSQFIFLLMGAAVGQILTLSFLASDPVSFILTLGGWAWGLIVVERLWLGG